MKMDKKTQLNWLLSFLTVCAFFSGFFARGAINKTPSVKATVQADEPGTVAGLPVNESNVFDRYIIWTIGDPGYVGEGGFLIAVKRDCKDGPVVGYDKQFSIGLNEIESWGYEPKISYPKMPDESGNYRVLYVWAQKKPK
jgi:hypothetical protein